MQPDWIMSFRTWPGPTLGSWFTSPTKMIFCSSVTASIKDAMSLTSIMLLSSMMIALASMGLS